MKKNRLEAFTDGVIAIIVTIMVLELDLPKSHEVTEIINFLKGIWIYALSFIYVAIYWMNHHHLFYTVKKIDGRIMLVNNLLLFVLSLIPIATKWLSMEVTEISVFFYGLILLCCGIIYYFLIKVIINNDNQVTKAIFEHEGKVKELISILIYSLGLIISFFNLEISIICYIIVAILWIIPEKKIENNLECMELNQKDM